MLEYPPSLSLTVLPREGPMVEGGKLSFPPSRRHCCSCSNVFLKKKPVLTIQVTIGCLLCYSEIVRRGGALGCRKQALDVLSVNLGMNTSVKCGSVAEGSSSWSLSRGINKPNKFGNRSRSTTQQINTTSVGMVHLLLERWTYP
jgi:hypothetical protein